MGKIYSVNKNPKRNVKVLNVENVDWAKVEKAFNREFREDFDNKGEKMAYRGNDYILISQDEENNLTGFAFLGIEERGYNKNLYITKLGVLKKYQRQGYATSILNTASKLAKKINADFVTLVTFNDNVKAVSLYLKQGFNISEFFDLTSESLCLFMRMAVNKHAVKLAKVGAELIKVIKEKNIRSEEDFHKLENIQSIVEDKLKKENINFINAKNYINIFPSILLDYCENSEKTLKDMAVLKSKRLVKKQQNQPVLIKLASKTELATFGGKRLDESTLKDDVIFEISLASQTMEDFVEKENIEKQVFKRKKS